jgi:hypothetical protein
MFARSRFRTALLLALRRWLKSLLCQDIGHRRSSDLDLQSSAKGVADLRVAPGIFSRAMSATSFRMSFFFRGRPTLLFELSYFCAASWRNHPKIVPGFTIWQHFFRSSGLKALPTTASRRR